MRIVDQVAEGEKVVTRYVITGTQEGERDLPSGEQGGGTGPCRHAPCQSNSPEYVIEEDTRGQGRVGGDGLDVAVTRWWSPRVPRLPALQSRQDVPARMSAARPNRW